VQVAGELDQFPAPVMVEPQAAVQRRDGRDPFLAGRECAGRDQGEPSGDLGAARAGQQRSAVQSDARLNKCGGQPFGEVFQRVGRFGACAGAHVQVVQLVGFTDRTGPDLPSDLR